MEGGEAFLIDTTGAVAAERVTSLIWNASRERAPQETTAAALQRLRVVGLFKATDLLSTLQQLERRLADGEPGVQSLRLLVVDSVSAVLSAVVGVLPSGAALVEQIGQVHLLVGCLAIGVSTVDYRFSVGWPMCTTWPWWYVALNSIEHSC